ncbi:hypothetical protein ACH4PX_11795 [Streptomyces anulatus]
MVLLHYAGSVGTGWSEADRARLAELLRLAATDARPFAGVPPMAGARWVVVDATGSPVPAGRERGRSAVVRPGTHRCVIRR